MNTAKVKFTAHAIRRMFERGLSERDILGVLNACETIEDYPDDEPFPSRLVLGFVEQTPVHVVVANNLAESLLIVVTVYIPDPQTWESDFRRRRKS